MTEPSPPPSALPALIPVAAAWSLYLPLGCQYLVFLVGGVMALRLLAWGGWRASESRQPARQPARQPGVVLALLLFVWMAMSMLWSRAPLAGALAHLWYYSLPLWLLPWALTLKPQDGRRALRHFVVASVIAAGLLATVWAERITGNQRIAVSLLFALAASFAVLETLDVQQSTRARAAWAGAALCCVAALSVQDRRTGMFVLPVLMLVLVWRRQPKWWPRLALLGMLVAAVMLVWAGSSQVRSRVTEGLAELKNYQSQGDVQTSWGMRLRMLEVTASMVRERPLIGHGVGAWPFEWRQRSSGSALLTAHTTPHNEYMLVAAQGGAIGLGLLIATLLALGGMIRRRGRRADAALLVWLAFVVTALFNAALRDAKFALPLLMLGALAWAASREPEHG